MIYYDQIKSLGAKAGVVLNPGTPLSAIEYVLDGNFHIFLSLISPWFISFMVLAILYLGEDFSEIQSFSFLFLVVCKQWLI